MVKVQKTDTHVTFRGDTFWDLDMIEEDCQRYGLYRTCQFGRVNEITLPFNQGDDSGAFDREQWLQDLIFQYEE